MPVAIPAILIGASIASGVSSLVGAFKGPPDTSKLEAQQAAQAKADAEKVAQQQAMSRDQMFRRVAPDAQAQTGGSLTDAPLAQLIASLAGQPGDWQSALHLTGHSPSASQPSSPQFTMQDFSLDKLAQGLQGQGGQGVGDFNLSGGTVG